MVSRKRRGELEQSFCLASEIFSKGERNLVGKKVGMAECVGWPLHTPCHSLVTMATMTGAKPASIDVVIYYYVSFSGTNISIVIPSNK